MRLVLMNENLIEAALVLQSKRQVIAYNSK